MCLCLYYVFIFRPCWSFSELSYYVYLSISWKKTHTIVKVLSFELKPSIIFEIMLNLHSRYHKWRPMSCQKWFMIFLSWTPLFCSTWVRVGQHSTFSYKISNGHQARRKKSNYGGTKIRFIYTTQQITWWFLTNVEFNNLFWSYSSEGGGSIPYLAFRYANYLTLNMIWRNFFIKNSPTGGGRPVRSPYIRPWSLIWGLFFLYKCFAFYF